MPKIISPTDPQSKPILTAQEMFRLWNWKRNDEVGVCEFAEAYAQERVREFSIALNATGIFIHRAAELLRHAELASSYRGIRMNWGEQRDQWLRDAKVEK